MTFWAKFLIIVILVLSLIFAAISTVLFAKRQDYRNALVELNAAFGTFKVNAKATEERLTNEKNTLNAELTNKNTELTNAQAQVNVLTDELKLVQGDKTLLQSTLDKEQANVKTLTIANQSLGSENGRLLAENESIRKENVDLTKSLADERNLSNGLQRQVAALTGERDRLQKDLAAANDTLRQNEEIFAELARRNIEAQPIIAGLTAMPDIKGTVVNAEPDLDFVILNVGSKQGVHKNYEFTVYRDGQFVAKVIVFHTQDDMSAARIVLRKLDIKRGDLAATRL